MTRSEVALLTAPPVAGTTCAKLSVDVTANSLYFRELDGTWTQLVVGAGGALTDGDYGDVIVSGGGTAMTIDANAVTYAQIQDVSASQRILGRISIGAGDVEELTPAQARTILGVGNAFSRINADSTLVLADTPGDTLNLVPGANVAFVVDPVTDTITITAAGAGGIVDGDKGDIVVGGGGTVWLIDNDVVTFPKIQNIDSQRILGRTTAGIGDVEALTAAQVRTMLGGGLPPDADYGDITITGGVWTLDNRINVMNYGALGDGATDDTAAIQAAIAAMPASGSELCFPSGTYLVTESSGVGALTITSKSKFLVTGYQATIKAADAMPVAAGNTLLYFANCSDFAIEGLTVDGNRTPRTEAEVFAHSVALTNCHRFRLESIRSINAVCDGIYIAPSNNADLATYCSDGRIVGCVADNSYRNAMSIVGGFNLIVSGGQYVNSNGTAPEAGIDVEADVTDVGGAAVSRNITIAGIKAAGNNGTGIVVSGQKHACVTIEECDLSDCDGGAIDAGATAIIRGNDIHDFTAASLAGVVIVSATNYNENVSIEGNSFRAISAAKPCVYVHAVSQPGTRVLNNTAKSVTTFITASAPRTKVIGNVVETASTAAPFAIAAADCDVIGNTIEDYIDLGIDVTNTSGTVLIANNELISDDASLSYAAIRASFAAGGTVIVTNNIVRQTSAGTSIAVLNAAAGGADLRVIDNTFVGFATVPFSGAMFLKHFGSGAPENAVTANVGSEWRASDGGSGTTVYNKESGTGDTGWVAVAPGAGLPPDADYGDISIAAGVWTIDADAVTYAKMQNVSTSSRIWGRLTVGPGIVEELTPANVRTMINVADGADVTNATTVEAAGAVMVADTSTAGYGFVIDEDDMVSDSDTKVPTQQSVKAYVASEVAGIGGNAFGTIAVSGETNVVADQTNDTLTFSEGTGIQITLTPASDTVTVATDGVVLVATTSTAGFGFVIDEDTMVSNLDTKVPTQQSVKAYVDAQVAAGVSDGDKGDITVSAGGTTWTIDADAVTYAKLQNISAPNLMLGRITAGAGNAEELTADNVRTIINVEDGADVTDATNVEAAGAVMVADTTTAGYGFVIDEDTMVSNLDTKVPTQQSVKAYVDAQVAGNSFGTIASTGETNVVADAAGDTLNIEAGAGIDITLTPGSDTITITNTAAATGDGTFTTLTADDTTPDVTGLRLVDTANTVATAYAGSYGGAVEGQLLEIHVSDSNTSFVNNASQALFGGVDIPASTSPFRVMLRYDGTQWKQVGGGSEDHQFATAADGTDNLTLSNSTTDADINIDVDGTAAEIHLDVNGTDRVIVTNAGVNIVGTLLNNGNPIGGAVADGDYGDITVSGTGATWTIDPGVVTYAKMQDVSATSRIMGRITAGAGDMEELTAANVLTIIGVEAGADVTDATNVEAAGAVMVADTSTAGYGFVIDEDTMVSNSDTKVPTQQSVKAYVDAQVGGNAFGTFTVAGTNLVADTPGDTLTITAGANITLTPNAGADSFEIAATGGGVTDGDKGDITVSGSGATWTIDNDVVTYAKIQNVSATDRILGRITAGAGDAEELTAANVLTIIGVEAGADVTDAANVEAAGAVMESDTTTAAMSFVIDEDDMVSNLATKVPTQQSVKAYVDAQAGGLPAGGTVGDLIVNTGSGTGSWSSVVSVGANGATITGGTVTNPATPLVITQTWNDVADTFDAIDVNVTSTNSAPASRLMNLRIGGTSQFSVSKAGLVTVSTITGAGFIGPRGNSTDPAFRFQDATAGIWHDNGGQYIGIREGSTEAMRIGRGGVFATTPFYSKRAVEANTAGSGAPNVLTAIESGVVETNEGTTAANYHTLPTAVIGLIFTFVVADADGLRVTSAAGDEIRIGNKLTATAGYIESTTIGDTVTLVAINAQTWVAISAIGTWTDGTFTFTLVSST